MPASIGEAGGPHCTIFRDQQAEVPRRLAPRTPALGGSQTGVGTDRAVRQHRVFSPFGLRYRVPY